MDDSSFFMQWAMNTLNQHSSAAAAPAYTDGGGDGEGASFPSLQALRSASQTTAAAGVRDLTVQVDHRASSWSSGDSPGAIMDHDAAAGWSPHTARASTGGGGNRPMSWNFSAASAQPTDESGGGGGGIALPDAAEAARAHTPAGKRGGSVAPSAAGGSAAAAPSGYVQDHIIAERRRREKINQRFIELSTVIPGLKKMDKATILGDAVKYVRELHEKVKSLEDDHNARSRTNSIQSVVLVRKPCLTSDADDGEPSPSAAHGGAQKLPEIEARLSEKSVLLRIHCENARGLLVRVLSEVEELRLAITHTSVMPFPACSVIITITAKVEEGFNATVEEIVRRLNSALHQYYSGNTEEQAENKK